MRRNAHIAPLLVTAVLGSCAIPQPRPTTRNVVMVHGILEDGKAFNAMRRRLERKGAHCLVPMLKPNDARHGIEPLARDLKHEIDAEFGPASRIDIIGFSMGGIVSRYYLQELGGAERCDHLFTISSPHQGTLAAYCYPGKGAAEMRPHSEFLDRLATSQSVLDDTTVVSYRTPLDLVILPSSSSIWDRAINISHPSLLHPFMLTSRFVIEDIEKRLFQESDLP